MDLGVIAMKGYSTNSRSLELDPFCQTQIRILPRAFILERSYTIMWDTLSLLYVPHIGIENYYELMTQLAGAIELYPSVEG